MSRKFVFGLNAAVAIHLAWFASTMAFNSIAYAQTPAHRAAVPESQIVREPILLQTNPTVITEIDRLVQKAGQLELEKHHLQYNLDLYQQSLTKSSQEDRRQIIGQFGDFANRKNVLRLDDVKKEIAQIAGEIEAASSRAQIGMANLVTQDARRVVDQKAKNANVMISFYNPDSDAPKSSTDAMLNLRQPIISDAKHLADHRFLQDPIEALQRKLEILYGQKIPRSVIESQDLSYRVDMSKAPIFRRILISTPYFHPVTGIVEALERAHARGVKIRIVTNVDFSRDDFLPSVVTVVNQQNISRIRGIAEIRVWAKTGELFHSKTMLIDQETLYMGSFNLNNRSFMSDVENGVLISGKKIATEYLNLFDQVFLPGSRAVSDADLIVKPSFFNLVKSLYPEFF